MKRIFFFMAILMAIVTIIFAQTEPSDLQIRLTRAHEKIEAGDTHGAILDFTAAIKIDTELSVAHFNRGVLFFNDGNFERAEIDFSTVIKLGERGISSEDEVNTAITYRAFSRNRIGDYEGALTDYSKALEINPENSKAYYSRGTLFFKTDQNAKAIEDFNKVLEIVPADTDDNKLFRAEAFFSRGSARFNSHDYDGSLKDYRLSLSLNPDFEEAQKNIEMVTAFLEHENNSANSSTDIDSINYYYTEGNKAYQNSNAEKTIELMNHVVRLNPDYSNAYILRGNAYFWLENYDNTIADMTSAISLKPDEKFSYFMRGHARLYVGQYTDAVKDFSKAIELDPNDVDSYINRALAWRELKQDEQAHADLDKAIEIAPDMAMAYFNRGNLLFYMEDFENAIIDFSKSIELDPENASAYFNRSSTMLRQSRIDKIGVGKNEVYDQIITDSQMAMNKSNSVMGAYNLASAFALSDIKFEAYDMLIYLFENKAATSEQIMTDIDWVHLHDEPEFIQIIERYK